MCLIKAIPKMHHISDYFINASTQNVPNLPRNQNVRKDKHHTEESQSGLFQNHLVSKNEITRHPTKERSLPRLWVQRPSFSITNRAITPICIIFLPELDIPSSDVSVSENKRNIYRPRRHRTPNLQILSQAV